MRTRLLKNAFSEENDTLHEDENETAAGKKKHFCQNLTSTDCHIYYV